MAGELMEAESMKAEYFLTEGLFYGIQTCGSRNDLGIEE